jgi:hypothetical protein
MTQPANPDLPANLLFRLRALFGVNARADILAYLLSHEDGHPPEIARQTGYFPKTIQMTLMEMECSGKIQAVRRGREKHYRLDQREWTMLRPMGASTTPCPRWVAWPSFVAAMTGIWTLLQNQKLAQASPALQAGEWQKQMNRIQPWLMQCNLGISFRNAQRLHGDNYLQAVQEDLLRCLATPTLNHPL